MTGNGIDRTYYYRGSEGQTMTEDNDLVSSIPDQPLTRSHVESLDDHESVMRVISPTWQPSLDTGEEHTEDLIFIFDDRVLYLSREPQGGWARIREDSYETDQEFEGTMDEVHDFACEYSEQRIEDRVRSQ
jgi:hypothetical protein